MYIYVIHTHTHTLTLANTHTNTLTYTHTRARAHTHTTHTHTQTAFRKTREIAEKSITILFHLFLVFHKIGEALKNRSFHFISVVSLMWSRHYGLLFRSILYVKPKAKYTYPSWNPLYQHDIAALEKVQRRFTKFLLVHYNISRINSC